MAESSELKEAIRAVNQAPHAVNAWDDVERLAAKYDAPDDVVALYQEVLAGDVSPDVAEMIGERAASFCDEWFGDEPKILEKLLLRVIELAPRSDSALQRLSVGYTRNARWPELLALYDAALLVATDRDRQVWLLREASQLAKDVAGRPEQAIGYLQSLLKLTPDDVSLGQSLERLLERHERFADLIALWEGRLDGLDRKAREVSRLRIAKVWLDNLFDAGNALAAVKPTLADPVNANQVSALVERIIEAPHTPRAVSGSALDLLRTHHDSAGAPREIIRVLEKVIAIDPAGSRALREEAGQRLADLEDDGPAMGHYAALLSMTPDSAVTQERLRDLAVRSKNFAVYAQAVVDAGHASTSPRRRVELLAEGARTRHEELNDSTGAIALYREALDTPGAGDLELLSVCRRLAELYAASGQQKARLDVLERLATLEPDPDTRRSVLGEAAQLAEAENDNERALGLWQQRLTADPRDATALDARIALLERGARWADLINTLEQRAVTSAPGSMQRRVDLVRIAGIQRTELEDRDAAIAAWQRVAGGAVDDVEAVTSLADLYAETDRWDEMARLLEVSSVADNSRTLARMVRLGDAYRLHLAAPTKALVSYTRALAIAPDDESALAGLRELLSVDTTRAAATNVLADALRRTDNWDGVLDLIPTRIADAPDDKTRLALLRESAQIRLDQRDDHAGALSDLATAFPLAPRDALLESQLQSLAASTGDNETLAGAYRGAIAALADTPREAARLQVALADLSGGPLGDHDAALTLYLQAAAAEPGDLRAVAGVQPLAARADRWDDMASVVVNYFVARERVDESLLNGIDSLARARNALPALATALSAAMENANVPSAGAATIFARIAEWHDDPALSIAGLRRALELGGERPTWLLRLVEAERKVGKTPALLEALRRLSDADARDLDVLVEAADMASTLGDRDQALATLTQVFGRSSAAMRGSAKVTSSRPADGVARWAIEGLVDLHLQAGAPRLALDTLSEAARLPFDAKTRRDLRLRGADVAATDLGDNSAAVDMLRSALAASPGDHELIERLSQLLETEQRIPELLSLRQMQLGLVNDQQSTLALRLEISKLVSLVEDRGGRLEALRANLTDEPGHDASIDALAKLYSDKRQYQELVAMLESQAQALDAQNEPARAARLWVRMADAAETHTAEPERAIAAHRKVVGVSPEPDSLRALARLNINRGQPALAVPWLESLMAISSGDERMEVLRQLAQAHLAAQQPLRAIAALEAGLSDRQPALELRVLQANLLRDNERWAQLAEHLTRSLPLIDDEQRIADFARESADIYAHRLKTPDRAITALQAALVFDPTSKELRASLATGLRVAGRLEEATALLTELIAEFGRRRSAERAPLHMELGRIYHAAGQLEEAMTEFEQASKMDVSNADYQKELAELAREAGQLDRAERTYRALLLVVRRQPPGDDEQAVGQSEVLFELHQLAAERGEADQAKELLESAVSAAILSDAEVRRLRRSVLRHGSAPTMIRVFELRLAASTEPLSQALLYADLAEVLEGPLAKPAEALVAMLRGIDAAPDRLTLHERARALSARTGQTRKYVDAVETVVDRLRRKDDPPLVAELLIRAGEALEVDAGDLPGAAAMFRRVETMGERLTDAFYAQARIAAALGNTEEQTRALDNMLQQTESASLDPTPDQLDAFYRLAELFMATAARRDQGLDLLERAFAAEPRWSEAARILRGASSDAGSGGPRVMALYERVARAGGEPEVLLDFLHKQALAENATPSQVREAVEQATALGDAERAETLLRRTVAAARDSAAGVGAASWAGLRLAELRLSQGDLPGTRELIDELAGVAETDELDALTQKAAAAALASGDNAQLAAELLEFLRERRPTDRAVWQPLLSLYRTLGDGDRLSAVVMSTLPSLTQAEERNAIRLEHAHFLIDTLQRHHDAIDVLKDALLDDPDNLEVAALLEQTLIDLGDDEGMTDFLWGRFEDAKNRGNRATTLDVAARLGALLDQANSPDAARVYGEALELAPDDRDLLRRVVAHRTDDDDAAETARLLERLLAVESPEQAPVLAAQLATAYEAAGDDAGVQRTLELAHQSAPDNAALHVRLEQWYVARELWAELAQMKTDDANHVGGDPAVVKLREAAAIYVDKLLQPMRAATVLRLAREHDPQSPELATELASALADGGETVLAASAVAEALADVEGPGRAGLLRLRARLVTTDGDFAAAVTDLREAYQLDPDGSAADFVNGLDRLRQQVAGDEAADAERDVTLELVRVAANHHELERGREILVAWIERFPESAPPLALLCDLDESIEHWDGVIAAATRLAYITVGEEQLAAADRAAQAAIKAGRPDDAVVVLEVVHAAQPSVDHVRQQLREFYELSGAHRQLAGILLTEADQSDDPLDKFAGYKRAAELLLYQVGDPAAAAVPAERALELSPDDFGVTMLSVDVLLGTGQTDQASRVLEASIAAQKKRTPELAVLQQRMARIAAAAGDVDGQLGWLKKAFDVDRRNGEIAAELAQAATDAGDYELALKPLRAISLMENPQPLTRPIALLWEAKIEHARGNRAKAELWAKKALREDPAYAEAQQFLDELAALP